MNRNNVPPQPGTPTPPEADDPRRRLVLLSALATGSSLLLPAFLGCGKRGEPRTADTGGAPESMPGPGPQPMPEAAATASPSKVSQASVQYQDHPKDSRKCADCLHFIAESNTCKLVEGTISPEGWCVLWTPKG